MLNCWDPGFFYFSPIIVLFPFVLSVDLSHLSCKLWFLGSHSGLGSYLLSLAEQLWVNVWFRGQADLNVDRSGISSLAKSSQNSVFWFYRPHTLHLLHLCPCHTAHHVVFTQPQDKSCKNENLILYTPPCLNVYFQSGSVCCSSFSSTFEMLGFVLCQIL